MNEIDTLIVGGAGYIGSHLGLLLEERGVPYVTLDSLERGHREFVRGELIECDIRDKLALDRCFAGRSFSTIYHFAAYAYVGESFEKPQSYFLNNLIGIYNLFEVALEHGLKKFVFSSTCSIYGLPELPLIVEDNPQNPISPYGQTKLMAENMLRYYRKQLHYRKVKLAILRYFNAAGADPLGRIGERHDPETHLIPLAIKAALGIGPPLTVFGDDHWTPDGTCIRDYVHVNDLAAAHLAAEKALSESEEDLVFNVGTGNGHSVLEVLKAVEKIVGKKVPYKVGDNRPGDFPKLVASNEKIMKRLGWSAKYSFDEIIETACLWHRKERRGFAL